MYAWNGTHFHIALRIDAVTVLDLQSAVGPRRWILVVLALCIVQTSRLAVLDNGESWNVRLLQYTRPPFRYRRLPFISTWGIGYVYSQLYLAVRVTLQLVVQRHSIGRRVSTNVETRQLNHRSPRPCTLCAVYANINWIGFDSFVAYFIRILGPIGIGRLFR